MSNCGDLVLISMIDTDTDKVAAFEDPSARTGRLGGPQTEPMILYPFDWKLDAEPLVGAPAVYEQLMRWMESDRSRRRAGQPGRPEEKAAA